MLTRFDIGLGVTNNLNLKTQFGFDFDLGVTKNLNLKTQILYRIVDYKNYDEMKYVVSTGSNAYISKPLAETSDEDLIPTMTRGNRWDYVGDEVDAQLASRRSTLMELVQMECQLQEDLNLETDPYPLLQAKFFINILAEPAEVVTECSVPNIRSIPTYEAHLHSFPHWIESILPDISVGCWRWQRSKSRKVPKEHTSTSVHQISWTGKFFAAI
ncbi:hypothetical protein C5167_039609 [Papaver somniferum]|uniref:Uncharacterized protein n=1 Tax=Papaver somniferum TaxID=3469 RepID=A0A4Y7IGU6_PAPSO|nr:hypothetical protein C5167_039609 [Papaver somniferum]